MTTKHSTMTTEQPEGYDPISGNFVGGVSPAMPGGTSTLKSPDGKGVTSPQPGDDVEGDNEGSEIVYDPLSGALR